MLRRLVATVVAVVSAVGISACRPGVDSAGLSRGGATTGSPAVKAGAAPTVCHLSLKLVPSCGVLWGVSTSPATPAVLETTEREIGRRFDLIYRYHDIVGKVPDDAERQAVAAGRVLHLAIAARVYGQPHDRVTYADIAAGKYDQSLVQQAHGLVSLGVPVFVTFEQEANQHRKLDTRGTAAQFKAAWRHVHDVYTRSGATNAVWVWVMTGASANLQRAGSLWPGNDVVDWISWNAYNQSGCGGGQVKPDMYQTFDQAVHPFYDWVHKSGPSLGIDSSKPMMISESGSVLYKDDLKKTAAWYEQIPNVLERLPQIKALALWASSTSPACDYRFQQDPAAAAGVATAGRAAYLNSTFVVPTVKGEVAGARATP